ncbi:hypothetical protein CMO89_03550 [Candidatus Woesearchaeota archaeon]|nr:hypothetical protein [Candidatus Woesearchaeota archaeon]|tara:strand:- start:4233 stop:5393 length:1161 start_codon:yes stop_codon:yes gene_type:complete
MIGTLEGEIDSFCVTFINGLIPKLNSESTLRLNISTEPPKVGVPSDKYKLNNLPEWDPLQLVLKKDPENYSSELLTQDHYRNMIVVAYDLKSYIKNYSPSEVKETLRTLKTKGEETRNIEKYTSQINGILDLTYDLYYEAWGIDRAEGIKSNPLKHLKLKLENILQLIDEPEQVVSDTEIPVEEPIESNIDEDSYMIKKDDILALSVSFSAMVEAEKTAFKRDPLGKDKYRNDELFKEYDHIGFEFPVYNPFTNNFKPEQVSLDILFEKAIPHLQNEFIKIEKQLLKLVNNEGYFRAHNLMLNYPSKDKPGHYLLPNLALTMKAACQLLALRFRRERKYKLGDKDDKIPNYFRKLPSFDHMKKVITTVKTFMDDYRRIDDIKYSYK